MHTQKNKTNTKHIKTKTQQQNKNKNKKTKCQQPNDKQYTKQTRTHTTPNNKQLTTNQKHTLNLPISNTRKHQHANNNNTQHFK